MDTNPEPQPVTIDRAHARSAFDAYVEPYDASDPLIALKTHHTYRVADVAERIARETGFTPAGIDLSWLCGLLHDIGRFEQARRWGTFRDSASASHAAIGVDVLFEHAAHLDEPGFANVAPIPRDDDDAFARHIRERGHIRAFVAGDGADELIRAAVGYHSDFRLPAGLAPATRAMADAVRDADKIDILRVACTDTVEAFLGVGEDELLQSTISPAAEEAFYSHRTVRRDERTTPLDMVVGLACFAYELAFPASLEILLEDDFLFELFRRPFGIERPFADRSTARELARMDGHLRAWLDERMPE